MTIIKRDTASAIILNNNNDFLLQKKDFSYSWFPGKWCLFGGGVEPGEGPEKALRRELEEEISHFFDDIIFFKKHEYRDVSPNGVREGLQYVYVTKFKGKISDIKIYEGAGFAFFSPSELDSIHINDPDLRALREYHRLEVS